MSSQIVSKNKKDARFSPPCRTWIVKREINSMLFQNRFKEQRWSRVASSIVKLIIPTVTDESPISITGFYTPCSNSHVSSHLTFLTESLPTNEQQTETSRGNRNKCSVPVILYNTNTLEGYHALDKQGLLKAELKNIWEDIRSGKAEEDTSVLSRFLLISFADLKKFNFH
ncbi:hypothetical protein L2E82_08961 [Cichorium intybus]|uniref:Uncharacterized protein n=1 Tax=Cichorium intybus TaxID=13427 RepID=A0ACB9G893_CICIN|nr:hypothetical protein L2E82_08961 [Cichorium intybus]